MANRDFSESFYYYRVALARWQAKNDYMLSEFRKRLNVCPQLPQVKTVLEDIISDLSLPCDSYLNHLEFR